VFDFIEEAGSQSVPANYRFSDSDGTRNQVRHVALLRTTSPPPATSSRSWRNRACRSTATQLAVESKVSRKLKAQPHAKTFHATMLVTRVED
jgi:hypothetical protein